MRDAHRIRDRMELSLEPRTVVWAVLIVAASVGGAFFGGYHMGAGRSEAAGEADETAAPLDTLDNLAKPRRAGAVEPEAGLTFHETLAPRTAGGAEGDARKKDKAKAKGETAGPATSAPAGSTASAGASAAAPAPALTPAATTDRDLLDSLGSLGVRTRGPEWDDRSVPAPVTAVPVPKAEPKRVEVVKAIEVAKAIEPAPAAEPAGAAEPPKAAAGPARTVERLPTPAAIAAGDPRYTVQVGSYPSSAEADRVVSRLEKKGYTPYVVEADVPGRGRWYRVRVGDFAARASAMGLKEEIEGAHGEPCLVTTR